MIIALLSSVDGLPEEVWRGFVLGAQQHFLPTLERRHFLFSESAAPNALPNCVTWCRTGLRSSPVSGRRGLDEFPTLPKDVLDRFDFVFYLSPELEFRRGIGTDILPAQADDLIVVQHPEFVNLPADRLPYERNTKSAAFVNRDEGRHYVTQQIFGGQPNGYWKLAQKIHQSMKTDFRKGVVAQRLREAHLNRYIIDHTYSLRHSGYCYPEGWDLGVPKLIGSRYIGQSSAHPRNIEGLNRELIVKSEGDLGSQLFQYANAFALAVRNGCRLALDTGFYHSQSQSQSQRGVNLAGSDLGYKYELGQFKISAEVACQSKIPARGIKSLQRLLQGRIGKKGKLDSGGGCVVIEERSWVQSQLRLYDSYRTCFTGSWHHTKLFEEQSQLLRTELTWDEPSQGSISEILNQIPSTGTIAVDLIYGADSPRSTPLSQQLSGITRYLQEAISLIRYPANHIPTFLVFTDNPIWARSVLAMQGNLQIIDVNEINMQFDILRLMAACQHHVISNSKLAWWAAWLNPANDKCVVIPSTELALAIWGDWLPTAENWISLEGNATLRNNTQAA